MKQLLLLFTGLLLSGIVISSASCQKNTDCKARIKAVSDSTGAAVSGAHVRVFATVKSPDGKPPQTGDVTAEGNTGGDGTVEFVFKLPAIFDVNVTHTLGTATYSSAGIIKLEEGQTVEKTFTLLRH